MYSILSRGVVVIVKLQYELYVIVLRCTRALTAGTLVVANDSMRELSSWFMLGYNKILIDPIDYE
jgi:hypothetical protein